MPYVSVPKDFTRIQSKIVFGLTKRQLLGLLAGSVIALPVYFLLRKPLGGLALYLAVLLAAPIFLCGFYRPKDGRPLEKIALNYIRVRFILPRVRPYQTQNIYESLTQMSEIQEAIEYAHAQKDQAGQEARPLRGPFKKRQKENRRSNQGRQT